MTNRQDGEAAKETPNEAHNETPNETPNETSPAQLDRQSTDPISNGHKPIKEGGKLGSGLKDRLKSVTKGPPGGFDDTPLPDAPQGYTVRIIFHGASNLPPADFATASSDPFIHATLKGTQPTRHKEDPDLVHRTRTIRRTTEPQWEEEWIVANVPPTGFSLKCRLYDEDYPDSDDRLGNVTIKISELTDESRLFPAPGKEFYAKKRMGSKRAYFVKGVASLLSSETITPRVRISMEILGKSDPPYAQMYTVGPTTWVKHYSPLIGRITGTKVNTNVEDDSRPEEAEDGHDKKKKTQKYEYVKLLHTRVHLLIARIASKHPRCNWLVQCLPSYIIGLSSSDQLSPPCTNQLVFEARSSTRLFTSSTAESTTLTDQRNGGVTRLGPRRLLCSFSDSLTLTRAREPLPTS